MDWLSSDGFIVSVHGDFQFTQQFTQLVPRLEGRPMMVHAPQITGAGCGWRAAKGAFTRARKFSNLPPTLRYGVGRRGQSLRPGQIDRESSPVRKRPGFFMCVFIVVWMLAW